MISDTKDIPCVLFVDDEPKVLEAHKRSFHPFRNKWSQLFASSGDEALSIFESNLVDVIVSDLSMPGMNGLKLASKVEEISPDTRFIILTGTADMQVVVNAINETRIFRFYLKPCSTEDLARGITDAIASRHALPTGMAQFDLGKAALDSLPYGIFIVDETFRVLCINAFSTELISRREGFSVGHDRILRASRASDTQTLHEALANAVNAEEKAFDSALFIERENNDKPLYCVVQQFLEMGVDDKVLRHAAVFVTDPDRVTRPSPEILAGLFELTASEARLLSCLVASGRLDQAAEDSNLTMSTARTYLKQIFSKTGTGKQGELIQLVLLSPAILKQ